MTLNQTIQREGKTLENGKIKLGSNIIKLNGKPVDCEISDAVYAIKVVPVRHGGYIVPDIANVVGLPTSEYSSAIPMQEGVSAIRVEAHGKINGSGYYQVRLGKKCYKVNPH